MSTRVQYANRTARTFGHYRLLLATFRNWPVYLAAKWRCLDRQVIRMRTRSGLQFDLPSELRQVFKDVFLYRAYVQPGMLAQLPVRPLIVDIGGNVGFFSLFALDLYPQARCLTFEPHRGNFQQLSSNRDLNPQTDWRLFQCAVAGTDGTARMCSPKDKPLATDAFIESPIPRKVAESVLVEEIQARTLESIFQQEGVAHCDWLKMDCEGAEYEILYRTPPRLFDRISAISLETHAGLEPGHNAEALVKYLEALGYGVWLADDAVIYCLK